MFEELGKSLGYVTRRTWSRGLPTDGVWLLPGSGVVLPDAAAVAIEVAVTEGPKAIKGSIDTLAEVSPALGILLIQDAEIRRVAVRSGQRAEVIDRRLSAQLIAARDRISRSQQRIEIWTYDQLRYRYSLTTGRQDPETLARLTH